MSTKVSASSESTAQNAGRNAISTTNNYGRSSQVVLPKNFDRVMMVSIILVLSVTAGYQQFIIQHELKALAQAQRQNVKELCGRVYITDDGGRSYRPSRFIIAE